jgi:hypothetical protein
LTRPIVPTFLSILCFGFSASMEGTSPKNSRFEWTSIRHIAGDQLDALKYQPNWEKRDLSYLVSPQSPGILVRMRSPKLHFFGELSRFNAEPPTAFWVQTKQGIRMLARGQSVRGTDMTASWVLTSFQGARGWERFDVPWFISLEKRPASISLTLTGLHFQFDRAETGYTFSMPLFGYLKLPQHGNDEIRRGLSQPQLKTWEWRDKLPAEIASRCDWWASVSKAFPVGFRESFSVDPSKDAITFRQDFRWLFIRDDWATTPRRFAPISPSLALAWKHPGFPATFPTPLEDPQYYTAFGPFVGAADVDRLEYSLQVLQYMNEIEWPTLPEHPTGIQNQALELIQGGLRAKFPNYARFEYDHGGRENLCWNLAGDIWYPRAIPYVDPESARRAASSLSSYMRNDVLRPHTPFHGKYILEGPGIGSWGGWGDAGKFMTNALQPIWAYAQYSSDWNLVRERWGLIKRFFITPEEMDWVSFGRYSIAELGDEAAPCSAYARMAWAVGDLDEYLLGAYTFSRELVHHYVKQRGARYFHENQPHHQIRPMPSEVFLTDLWGGTAGWQIDGPKWGHLTSGEHQSANRWVRFHDPDVGRFYRDHLAAEVQKELEWYEERGRSMDRAIYDVQRYREWLSRDNPHIMPSLIRLRSFLSSDPIPPRLLGSDSLRASGWGAADIAKGYALLRKSAPVRYVRLVPRSVGGSPFVLGTHRNPEQIEVLNTVQEIRTGTLSLEPRWTGWGVAGSSIDGYLSFGTISGEFSGDAVGDRGSLWASPGCKVEWSDAVASKGSSFLSTVSQIMDPSLVSVIGPFSNENDSELTGTVYPPEKEFVPSLKYPGLNGATSWRQMTIRAGRIDLRTVLESRTKGPSLAYLSQMIWAPTDLTVMLHLNHQGGFVAWVNGNLVSSFHGAHRPTQDGDRPTACRLQKGWNRLLLKLESTSSDYSFGVRLDHPDKQVLSRLKYSSGTT